MSVIDSPCILVCSIDDKTGYCFGCGRTRDEITQWLEYSKAERTTIIQELDERLKTVERKPRRITKRQRLRQQKTPEE